MRAIGWFLCETLCLMCARAAATSALLERDTELYLLERVIERAERGHGGVVLVEGQAGVGKTELLRVAGSLGQKAGLRAMRGRGTELDRPFGFGVVRQLLERCVRESPALLGGGAESSAAVFTASPAETAAEDGLFAHLHGLYWLAVNLAEHQPLLLLADDLHWADTASLRWLVYLAERVEDLPLALICATRPAEPGADQALIDVLASIGRVVRPAPLSAGAAAVLVRRHLPGAVDEFTAACHAASGGNAFLLGELLAELVDQGVAGNGGEAAQVVEFGSERVGHTVRRRLRLLPDDATTVARAIAILGPPTPLRDVATLTELPMSAVAAAAEALVAVNVLAADRDVEFDFVHPVVRSAVYVQTSPHERQRLHARAAGLMQARGAESERVGRHVLRLPAEGDPARVGVLRAAAREAAARGAADSAINYLQRALDEPPAENERGGVMHELGLAEAADRRRDEFESHLRAAMALTEDSVVRSRIALDLGRALASCGEFRRSVEIFHQALAGVPDRNEELGVALEAEMLAMAFHEFTCTALVASHWERRFAELEAHAPLAPRTLAPLVVAMAASRPPARVAIALAQRALEAERLDAPNSVIVGAIGNGLIYSGALAQAARVYHDSISAATRRGNRLTVAWQSTMRSKASLRMGETRRAEAEARLALRIFEEGSGEPGVAWCVAHLLDALLARGGLGEATELVKRKLVPASAAPTLPVALLHSSLAHFHLAQGQPEAALREATSAGRLVSATVANPYCCDWRSTAALALLALRRRDAARAMAEDELADARRFGVPEAEGASLRTLGLVIGGVHGLQALRRSVAVLEHAEGLLEHARSLLELGAALRRAGIRTEARDVLRAALDETARIGASGLADRAHAELVTAGARPRRDRRLLSGRESLTASEDRIAALAAEGLTNREIAQRQFVTVKAVEWHLSNVYRKLDISSRDELAGAIASAPQAAILG
jgi:DNA-binding CsgD family transcriptional regulator